MSRSKKQRPFTLLSDAWADFLLSRQAMQVTEATIKNYTAIIIPFITWLEEQHVITPDQITSRHVRQYLATFYNRTDWTVHTVASRIRAVLRFWHTEGYLPQPITFEMPKVHQKRLPYLTLEQVKKILKTCNLRERAMILFMLDSGLRRREICNLNRSDVDIKTGAVRVQQGKGRKDRIAVIGATARRTLLRYWQGVPDKRDDAPLFQTEDGWRFTGHGLQSLFRRLSEKSGVKVTPHMLRRTFATSSLKNGIDVVSLQMLLGHSSLETTRQYIQWLDADLLDAHRRASPVDNWKL